MSWDIFISYAHQGDNTSREAVAAFVARLHSELEVDFRRRFGRNLEIFFDKEDIKDFDHWQVRCHRALRESRFFIVCLSRSYLRSNACRWEWEEWCRHELEHGLVGQGAASLWFVKLEDLDAPEDAALLRRWKGDLLQRFHIQCHEWRHDESDSFLDASARAELQQLTEHVAQRLRLLTLDRARRGNLSWPNANFVGRETELKELRAVLLGAPEKSPTGIHGVGGMGKTALAQAFVFKNTDAFPAGCWLLRCEGCDQLLTVFRTLVPELEIELTDQEKRDDGKAVRRVFDVLRARGQTLFVFDNVDHPALLALEQMKLLADQPWARVLYTTRLAPDDFTKVGAMIRPLDLDRLPEDQAVHLICRYQPEQAFASPEHEAAAHEIVRELSGLTLAVETAAVYLGQCDARSTDPKRAVDMRNYLNKLREDLKTGGSEGVMSQLREVTATLRPTLARLDEPTRNVLQLAALLPSDSLPLPWLRDIAGQFHPSLAVESGIAEHDEWTYLIRALIGMRLLNPTSEPCVLSIHRLLQRTLDVELRYGRDELGDALDSLIGERIRSVSKSSVAPAEWELDALIIAVPARLELGFDREISPRNGLRNDAIFFTDKIVAYRTVTAAKSFLTTVYEAKTKIVNLYPQVWGHKRYIAACLQRFGQIAEIQGDFSNALKYFSESCSALKRFLERESGDVQAECGLAALLNKLGDIALKQNDLAKAAGYFSESSNIARRMFDRRSRREHGFYENMVCHALCLSQERQGTIAQVKGNLCEAERFFSESLKIAQDLVETDPSNADWQKGLCVSLNNLGDIAVAQGDRMSASRFYIQAKDIVQHLSDADPSNAEWQKGLAVSLNNLGDLAMAQEDTMSASHFYSQAKNIAQRLAETDPSNAEWQKGLYVSFNNLGGVALAQGDNTRASNFYSQAKAITQIITAPIPPKMTWQNESKVSPLNVVRAGEVPLVKQLLDRFSDKSTDTINSHVAKSNRDISPVNASRQATQNATPMVDRRRTDVELLMKTGRAQDALDLLGPMIFPDDSVSMDHTKPLDARIAFLHALMLAQNPDGFTSHLNQIPEKDDSRVRALHAMLAKWKASFTWMQRLGLRAKPLLPPPPVLD